MTKDEFRAGLLDAFEAMKDPNDEIHKVVPEGREISNELRPFDPVLATKVDNICDSIQDVIDYFRLKSEG